MENPLIIDQTFLLKKQEKFLNFFWLGFFIYSTGLIIASSGYLSYKICQAIQALGLILFVIASINLIKFKLNNEYLRIIYTLYFAWLISIVIRGLEFPIGYDVIKEFLFSSGLVYITPLILLFPKNFTHYKKIFNVIIAFGISYLLFDVIFIKQLLNQGQDPLSQGIVENLTEISLPVGFILLTYVYHSSKRNVLAIGIILITLLFTIIRARRGLIFITSGVIISSYILYLSNSNKRILILYLSMLCIALAALYATSLYNINNNKIFGFLADRGNEDTRTGVELYFYDDMKTSDWIVGKGMAGTYYCPDVQIDQPSDFRSGIETGYLQIILKGGLISLGLLMLIIVPAIFKGVFYSKNLLSKAAGIWIFLFITNLYPQNAVTFDLSYLMVWISVGICYSDEIRKMTDPEIKEQLILIKKNKTKQ